MLKLWLLPNVWLHGSQSTITGGRSARNGQPATIAAWFAQSIRCVLTTPFGVPVDPDVNRIFAALSGPTAANARSTSVVGAAGIASNRGTAIVASARANASPSAHTAPGARIATSARNFA